MSLIDIEQELVVHCLATAQWKRMPDPLKLARSHVLWSCRNRFVSFNKIDLGELLSSQANGESVEPRRTSRMNAFHRRASLWPSETAASPTAKT
jgi:hypothetical protein